RYPFTGNIRELKNVVEFSVSMAQGPLIQPHELPAYLMDGLQPEKEGETPHIPASSLPSRENTWEETERTLILDALKRAGGKRQKAAEELGWSRSTLWRKMARHKIQR
ncbi:MAG: sigma-54-dependent Fis family transcriptional regulator, partial [Desulfobacterales bacterium]|nr:sigma-54-dependent Fis family transcriptional regulator [Desulfobacterales bacterium]